MALDINGLNSNSPHSAKNNKAQSVQVVPGGTVSAHSTDETGKEPVTLSSESKSLHQVEKNLVDLPDVDEAKVEHFKNLINSGDYQPDDNQIAAKILDSDF